ncbi:MAG: sigma-70 family RNA polymerase sigma factor [Gemmatimonadetes bacterium]|nr:sigma-70 family RNA polymerase sigma factor [Gemmatimonadota bacterium]MXX71756.1 sigma-70 family RNA polymerase sigma factor [Gemmatimonadota bacterium]MYC91752.1 sigma-70 family RNA polymerase sigma factor [Gemmatimonadota bacterium]MYG36445.1 sigma-70 family RNA polymerase sigma factor [Gemmatimonadota bacterium]
MRSLQLMRDTDDTRIATGDDRLDRLMAAIKGGSSRALGRLMSLCWDELVRYAASQLGDVEVARDVVQEAFIQVWERRRGWQPRGSARAYLYRIVRHLVIDEKRKQGVRRRWAEGQRLVDAPRPATPAEELDAKVLADAFEAAVASLPDRRREVFELVFQRGLSHAEAAAVLDISAQTVANQMSAALRSVRRAIKED